MSTIEQIHAAMPKDRVNLSPLSSPACFLTELLNVDNLTRALLAKKKLRLNSTLVSTRDSIVPSSSAKVIKLPWRYLNYDARSAIVIESSRHELEGFILGPNIAGVRQAERPLFGEAEMISNSHDKMYTGGRVGRALSELQIDVTHEENFSLNLIILLLSMNDIKVGPEFRNNVTIFSSWLKERFPHHVDRKW